MKKIFIKKNEILFLVILNLKKKIHKPIKNIIMYWYVSILVTKCNEVINNVIGINPRKKFINKLFCSSEFKIFPHPEILIEENKQSDKNKIRSNISMLFQFFLRKKSLVFQKYIL